MKSAQRVAGITAMAVLATMLLPLTYASPGDDGKADAARGGDAARVVEIRSYNLKPGTRDRFHRLFLEDAWPMLKRARMDVVAYGPSLHDENSYFLMRAFPGVDERQQQEDAFYGSAEWREGPREAILDCIESYTTVVVDLDAATIESLRKLAPR